jgi:hypothetical protein
MSDDSEPNGSSHSPVAFYCSFLSECNVRYVRAVHKYLNFATLSKCLLHVFMYCDFVLHAVHGTETYLNFSTFTSRTISLQGASKAYDVSALTP